MSVQSSFLKIGVKRIAAMTTNALVLGVLGVAGVAGAQPGPDQNTPPTDCPKAQNQDNARFQRGPGMDDGRQASRRDGQGDANREGRRRPPRGEFGPGPDGNGPPRGGFGPGRDGYGPPPQGEFGPGRNGGRRQARAEFAPEPDGNAPRRSEFGPGPDRVGRPERPAPPVFSDFDADGDGNISQAEFDAFHAKRMANRPPRPQGPPRMDDVAPPAPPVAAPAPVAPPAPPAE